jgi:hypothetical protein
MVIFKITQEEINQYLARFTEITPLVIYGSGKFPSKYQIDFVESDIDLEFGLSPIENIDPNKNYKIVAGFNKIKLEDFICRDSIDASGELPRLFNKRLVDKIQVICPNDFIALPVTIINLTNEVEPYQNNDFYIVNAINTLDAIDKEKSIIHHSYEGDPIPTVKKRIYKENPWQGHLIAFEKNISAMIWHPRLAKELYPSKQFEFLTPEEDSFWHGSGFLNGHNRETYSIWMNGVVKTMAYPKKSLYKFMGEKWN